MLTAAWTIVIARLTDDEQPPPPPPTQEEKDAKWAELIKHMSWGAAKRLISSLPPVVIGRQIHHNIQVARSAAMHTWQGDLDLAGAAVLELPQQNAEAAASIITGPVEAALAIPDGVRTVLNSNADPEKRGDALVATAQNVGTVVATAVGVARSAKGVPDNAVVCRGGTCTAERFANGSGVTLDGSGRLQGVSVNVGATLEAASEGIPNGQAGATTAGQIRAAGGEVVLAPTRGNPNHATMSGVTPKQAERLFTPTVSNPSRRK